MLNFYRQILSPSSIIFQSQQYNLLSFFGWVGGNVGIFEEKKVFLKKIQKKVKVVFFKKSKILIFLNFRIFQNFQNFQKNSYVDIFFEVFHNL